MDRLPLLWVGAEYAIKWIHKWCMQRRQPPLTGEEDQYSAWSEEMDFLQESGRSNKENQTIVRIGNNENDALLSPQDDLKAFSRQADELLNALKNPILNPEGITQLSKNFEKFKQLYHQLLIKYHPDKHGESEKKLSTEQFQAYFTKLRSIYDSVKACVNRELESSRQKSWQELINEERDLLLAHIELVEKHLMWLNKAEEELNAIELRINGLDIGIERNAQGSAKNAELLERNEECIKRIDAVSDHVNEQNKVLVRVLTRLTQKRSVPNKKNAHPNDDKNSKKVTSPFFS